jgi:hypothetical protein
VVILSRGPELLLVELSACLLIATVTVVREFLETRPRGQRLPCWIVHLSLCIFTMMFNAANMLRHGVRGTDTLLSTRRAFTHNPASGLFSSWSDPSALGLAARSPW